jgi:hypothetical protein
MPFPRDQVDELLKACHRRCCVCHRFCGVKIETDHIVTKADDGPDSIDNAIPVCFECHAEIHSYNDKHPRGRKFRPEELRLHKEQWLEICRTKPEIFITATRNSDVGPLQALIDELEFNLVVSGRSGWSEIGCLFHDEQLRRGIREGSIAVLNEGLKQSILDAYVSMGAVNERVVGILSQPYHSQSRSSATAELREAITDTTPKVHAARDALLSFLCSDSPASEK